MAGMTAHNSVLSYPLPDDDDDDNYRRSRRCVYDGDDHDYLSDLSDDEIGSDLRHLVHHHAVVSSSSDGDSDDELQLRSRRRCFDGTSELEDDDLLVDQPVAWNNAKHDRLVQLRDLGRQRCTCS